MTDETAFAPGQVWSLKGDQAAMRVRIGALDEEAEQRGVHIEISHAPLPEGFEIDPPPVEEAGAPLQDAPKTISIGHVPITEAALRAAVDALEAEDKPLSPPFEEGYAAWLIEKERGRAGYFNESPQRIVELLLSAFKQSRD